MVNVGNSRSSKDTDYQGYKSESLTARKYRIRHFAEIKAGAGVYREDHHGGAAAEEIEKGESDGKWKKEDLMQMFTLQVAEFLTEVTDAAEDVLRGLAAVKFAAGDMAAAEKMMGTLCKMHKSAKDQYLKSSVANKMGLQASTISLNQQDTGG